MMVSPRIDPPLPSARWLRWLMDAGPGIPEHIRSLLLGEMVGTPAAALPGPCSAIIVNLVAIGLGGGRLFGLLLALEITLLAARLAIMARAARNARRGRATPPDRYFILAIGWCALQGAMVFGGVVSAILPLQILTAVSMTGLLGPICARCYGAPRYAMLLLALCYLPLVAAVQLIHEPWLVVMVLQVPLLFTGAGTILKRYHSLSVSALLAREQSQHRAMHDSLTGLPNRAGLSESLARFDATRHPFALFYIDLDGFKPVNDSFGHWAGDLVLAGVAERLLLAARRTDIVARLGGDEFVIVATGMPPPECVGFAERLIRQLTEQPYLLEGIGPVRIGASVGFACGPEDGVEIDILQRRADAALYDAKAAGKGVARRFVPQGSEGFGTLDTYPIPDPASLRATSASQAGP